MGVHSTWATTIAAQLNDRLLPSDYFAIPNTKLGGVEVDVGTLREGGALSATEDSNSAAVWAPPAPSLTAIIDFNDLDIFEVQVLQDLGGPQLRAAIELISPANKDRPSSRHAFAVKCASYLQSGASVIVVDIVTDRSANLHAEILQVLNWVNGSIWQSPSNLYVAGYRTTPWNTQQQFQAWLEPLAIGDPLPTLALWLDLDLYVPLRLEESYVATCSALRIRD
jgi:hypothetical protein